MSTVDYSWEACVGSSQWGKEGTNRTNHLSPQGAERRKAWSERQSAFITEIYIQESMLSLKAKPRHEPAPPFHILGALAQARGHRVETGSLTLTPAQSPRTAEFASTPVPRLPPTVAAALASVPRKSGPMRLSLVPDSSATYCPQGSLRVDWAGSRSAQGLCLGHFPQTILLDSNAVWGKVTSVCLTALSRH